jgi:hypothetical protein
MPKQSSLGAGVIQTAMRLSMSLGIALTAAVYGSARTTKQGLSNPTFPFERAYLCSIIFAITGLLFVPFMRIGKQGVGSKPDIEDPTEVNRPRTAGEYSDRISLGSYEAHNSHEGPHRHEFGHEIGNSSASIETCATNGSQDSYFPRWSWEGDKQFRQTNILYEVCVKCLEERRVIVGHNQPYGGAWHERPVGRIQGDTGRGTGDVSKGGHGWL